VESAELIAILREVRDRVRARHPQGSAPGNLPLPDLLPLVHARDAAMGKVASIGTVNPRRGGPLNGLVQGWKHLVARILDWHVREQVVFNRKVMDAIDAAIEALNDNNRALQELAGRIAVAEELKDLRSHWAEWHVEWERKLQQNEVQFLRSVADLQGAFQHRVTLMDSSFRESVRGQHAAFEAALAKSTQDILAQTFAQGERMRLEYERLIHTELRVVRQRLELQPLANGRGADSHTEPRPSGSGPGGLGFDYGRFAERFRGSEEYVKAGQQVYLPYFQNCRNVLDLGCGRGEFLELLRAAGIPARGIDVSPESVALCRTKGLEVQAADLFAYLEQPESACDGIFCAQVVEHLPPERLPGFVRLAASRLERGGIIAIETPNPECLAIFASHFYLDPTHTRPVPHPLLIFYLEEFGVGGIEVKKLAPAVESMPSLESLPADLREAFFGGLDYAVIGKKL
jgi:2-polyprenyl-3-methyl-5-hydroxy-6-metoxy-1,4-benzoquinol methylase